ncbi:hypothetical protein [Asanoa sp. NPDC050611]|uniref:hypothetical protein n=1 Tax=Asanoa sp. NPDC050611 TaxID=3157098 RepID=UPI0033C0DF0C
MGALPGGFINTVVRVGDSIRRPPASPFVHRLLDLLADWPGAPRFLGGSGAAGPRVPRPHGTVYGPGPLPIAFVDWDIAAPGERVHDVARTCWQFVGLGPGAVDAGRGVRLVCDAYGLTGRSRLVETILWWQDRCWRGIDAAADAGEPAMVRLRASGAMAGVRAAYDWTSAHRGVLERAVR